MRILYLGDIYGNAGLEAVEKYLPRLRREFPHDLLFVNGENVSDGLGLRRKEYKRLMSLGVHAVTLGNHAFSKRELFDFIDHSNIVRPLNYPKNTPGSGIKVVDYNGIHVGLLQVMGRIFMHDPLNNPFEALDEALKHTDADYLIVEVHGETTSEKLALGHYLDGRVDAVVGSHTHVPTADAMQLPKGTLYLTDLGMCGKKYGILGADRELVLKKFTTGMPVRLRPETDGPDQLNGVLIDLEQVSMTPVRISE